MSEQEDRELDQTISFLESPESEYLDKNAGKERRTRLDFLAGSLVVLQKEGPMTMTHVMFKLYTSHGFYLPIFRFLVARGFIQEVQMRTSAKKHYGLTEKGFQAAELYKQVKELFS